MWPLAPRREPENIKISDIGSAQMSEDVTLPTASDNFADAVAAVTLVAVFVVTCIYWVASQ
ncbi:hypothetical protein MNKW57_24640 [Biformimicrobium ophioploci]|uniref:Uncharacterized protein n=1 Tax=Biformimicrobium ophioploci TaxID=3036711 RepID=A0ABQ6M1B9_9GAMM|nr:hypothetical protein MNKW57_24640 [Microbulbifer sp. NKW57]